MEEKVVNVIRNADGTFAKGTIANPAGRAPIPQHEKLLIKDCRDLTPKIFERIRSILMDGSDRDALSATRILLEYGFGKPKQIIAVENLSEHKDLKDITSVQLVNEMLQLEEMKKQLEAPKEEDKEEKRVEGEMVVDEKPKKRGKK